LALYPFCSAVIFGRRGTLQGDKNHPAVKKSLHG
jgi:hypothetical protein